jgi:hypothetical protein
MGAIGLDYTEMFKMASRLRIAWTPALLKKIQALERATLKMMRPKADK